MTNVAVVYHSGYGHTAAVAEHVGKGAEVVAGTSAKLYKAEELSSPDSGPGPNWLLPTPSYSAHRPTWDQPPPA